MTSNKFKQTPTLVRGTHFENGYAGKTHYWNRMASSGIYPAFGGVARAHLVTCLGSPEDWRRDSFLEGWEAQGRTQPSHTRLSAVMQACGEGWGWVLARDPSWRGQGTCWKPGVWIQASEWLRMGVARVRIKQPRLCGEVIVKGLLRRICRIYLLPGSASLKLPEYTTKGMRLIRSVHRSTFKKMCNVVQY